MAGVLHASSLACRRACIRYAGAVFSPVEHTLSRLEGELFPLHLGDTWIEPCVDARMESLRVADYPSLHRYNDTRGLPTLVDALVEKVRGLNGLPCERESILLTAGATGALCSALGMLAEPGDEILLLAPYWPLIRGIAQTFGAVPVDVPFYGRVDSPEAAREAILERISERTVALYLSTPSNPTGVVLPEAWLHALAEVAEEKNLWILSDEVYEAYVYQGRHVSIAALAESRTLTIFSFSKTYGMAGNRVGVLHGPPRFVTDARKISTHTTYAAPTAGQVSALRALEHGAAWLSEAREAYRAAGEDAASVLGLDAPEGSMFLFLDVAQRLDDRGVYGFLEDCLEDGVVLAPGSACGEDFGSWVRICYTAAPPDRVAEAVRRLAKRL